MFDAPAPSGASGSPSGASASPMNGGVGSAKDKSKEPVLPQASEAVIKRSLVVGNFEAAVQCCISMGNMADAMILAR